MATDKPRVYLSLDEMKHIISSLGTDHVSNKIRKNLARVIFLKESEGVEFGPKGAKVTPPAFDEEAFKAQLLGEGEEF